MPILGIYASANQFQYSTAFESIATVTGNGSSSTLSFTSIPQTYKHLQIRGICNDSAGYYSNMNFNSDTANNYSLHQLYGDGSTVTAAAFANFGSVFFTTGNAGGNYSSAVVCDILDYTNTSKNKTCRILTGTDSNGTGSGYMQFNSAAWYSTSAITRIDIKLGGTFSTNTIFALYGIKG